MSGPKSITGHPFYIQPWITDLCTVPIGSLNFCSHEVEAVLLNHTPEMLILLLTPVLFCFVLLIFVTESLLWRMKEITESVPFFIHLWLTWFLLLVTSLKPGQKSSLWRGWDREYPVLVFKLLVLEMPWSFLLCHILCICPFFSLYFLKMPFLNKRFCFCSYIQVFPPFPLKCNDATALSEKQG